jgi:hypothetical protein
MAGFAKPELSLAQPSGWFDQLSALLARELAPSSRKLRTALRLTTIATLGAGLVASCHVNNQLGTYIVWLLVGAGPMMSVRRAGAFLIVEALALAASIVMARTLAETPWLMLPFLFALLSFSTYLGIIRKLGAPLLLIEVVCLDTFYGVVFAPQEIGWGAAGAFGGSVIAFGTLVLFDNWLWPDRAEGILLESLGASVAQARSRLLEPAGGAAIAQRLRVPVCGLIAQYNGPSGGDGTDRLPATMREILSKSLTLRGFIYYEFAEKHSSAMPAPTSRRNAEDIVDGLEKAPEAFIGMLDGHNFGKVIVRVGA